MDAKVLYTGKRVVVKRTGRKYAEPATVFAINEREERAYVMLQSGKLINVACEQISEPARGK